MYKHKLVLLTLFSGLSFTVLAQSADTTVLEIPDSTRPEITVPEEEVIPQVDTMAEEAPAMQEEEGRNYDDITFYPINVESDNLASFQVFDSLAINNRFIFTGEDHRVQKFNTYFETRMMKYLHQHGYRYYIMEAGKVSAFMLNKYLVEGDSLAGQIVNTYYNHNFARMFESLKVFNDSLPLENKIMAVGLDIERDAPMALRTLLYLLPDRQAPDSLEMFVESLKIISNIHIQQAIAYSEASEDEEGIYDFGGFDFDYYFDDEEDEPAYFHFNMVNTIKDLTTRFREKDAEFREYLGENYADFAFVIKEMENWLIWIGYEKDMLPQSWVYREQYMEGNFREFFKDKPEAKGFGQFGRCHISRATKVGDCGFAFFSSLNKRIITKMPELEHQVASIGIFYPGLRDGNRIDDNGNISDLIELTEKGTANLFLDLQEYGDEELNGKFSSIIIVKSNFYDEDYEWDDDDYDYDAPDFAAGFEISFNYRDYDMNSFTTFSRMDLKTPLEHVEISYTVKTGRTEIRNAYGFFPKVNYQTAADTSKQSLSGWSYHYTVGYDILRPKWLDLTPSLGFNYMRLKYTERRMNAEPSYFGTSSLTEFYNPAFLLDGRLTLGIKLGIFMLQGFAGYTYDVSRSQWQLDKERISDGPKTKMSGLYYGAGFGLRFAP